MTRRSIPLEGHAFHAKTDDQLHYICKDAGEAARNMRGFDYAAECKYLDQVNDACTILYYRRRGDLAIEAPHDESLDGAEAPGFDSHDNGEAANDYYATRNFRN